jgi:N-acetylglucosaminyl-diphospho-decaprenol L-rhamnosyltransferase
MKRLRASAGRALGDDVVRVYVENANLGVAPRRDCAELVIGTKDDVEFLPGMSAVIAQALRGSPGVGVVGPVFSTKKRGLKRRRFGVPSVASETAQSLILPAGLSRRLRSRFGDTPAREITSPDWILGAVLMFRRSAFIDVGGFDPTLFLYSGETDVCGRLRLAGWRSLSVGSAHVVDHGAASTGADVELLRQSRQLYIGLHWSAGQVRLLRCLGPMVALWNRRGPLCPE